MIIEKEILLAPNGKLSNLTPEQYRIVRTPEFKAWFGDWEKLALVKRYDSGIDEVTLSNLSKDVSKVVDENGEPLVVYHRTDKKFNVFDKEKLGTKSGWNTAYFGFYFSEKNEKGSYGKRVMKCFLNISNPFFINSETYADFDYDYKNFDAKNFKSNDGILITVNRLVLDEKSYKHFVVFEPNQIKLADGNNTTFDISNPDIRFGNGGEIKNFIKNIRLIGDDEDGKLYFGEFGKDGTLTWIKYGEEVINVYTINSSKGYGANAIASLFLLNPKVKNIIYQDHSKFNDGTSFWTKIGGDSDELNREDFFKYFENKFGYNPDIRFDKGGIVVGENMADNEFPTIEEAYEIIRDSHTLTGGVWVAENEDEEMDALFDSVLKSHDYVKEVYFVLKSLYDKENIPVYRCVKADKVDLEPYGIGESWSFSLSAAKEFGSHLGVRKKDLKIISGIVPRQNVDWKKAFELYHHFSSFGDSDSEFELPIPSNNKILDVMVSEYDEAVELN